MYSLVIFHVYKNNIQSIYYFSDIYYFFGSFLFIWFVRLWKSLQTWIRDKDVADHNTGLRDKVTLTSVFPGKRGGCLCLITENNLSFTQHRASYRASLSRQGHSTQSAIWTVHILGLECGQRVNSQSSLCWMSWWNKGRNKSRQHGFCRQFLEFIQRPEQDA